MLKEKFIRLVAKYTADKQVAERYWKEIATNYSKAGRHYHTLRHLESLLKKLEPLKTEIRNMEAVMFALYYHDIIYNALKSDNEEKSAKLAEMRLTELLVPESTIADCRNLILATKKHGMSADNDINVFTDADLAILGESWENYAVYFKQVRMEYSAYPDFFYNRGRKKMLRHFLEMDRIYKTNFFFEKYELQARQNLHRELDQLK